MTRSRTGLALVVAGCLLAPVAVTAQWVRSEVLDTDTWVATVGPLVEDPVVADALAARLGSGLSAELDAAGRLEDLLPGRSGLLADRFAEVADELIERSAELVVRSELMERIWVEANRVAHEALVAVVTDGRTEGGTALGTSGGGALALDLGALAREVADRVGAEFGVDLFGVIGADRLDVEVVLLDADQLAAVRGAARILDLGATTLVVAAVVALVGGSVVSPRRGRAVLVAGCGLALSMAVLLGALALGRRAYLASLDVSGPDADIAAAVHDALVGPAVGTALWILSAGLVAALVAVAGPRITRAVAAPRASSSDRPSGRSG